MPAFLTMISMPATYSIANGIALGLVVYPITMVVCGRGRELHPVLYGLFVIFVLYSRVSRSKSVAGSTGRVVAKRASARH